MNIRYRVFGNAVERRAKMKKFNNIIIIQRMLAFFGFSLCEECGSIFTGVTGVCPLCYRVNRMRSLEDGGWDVNMN